VTRFPCTTGTYEYVDATLPDKVALRNFVGFSSEPLGGREGGNGKGSLDSGLNRQCGATPVL